MTERIDLGAELADYTGNLPPRPPAAPAIEPEQSRANAYYWDYVQGLKIAAPPEFPDRCQQCRRYMPGSGGHLTKNHADGALWLCDECAWMRGH